MTRTRPGLAAARLAGDERGIGLSIVARRPDEGSDLGSFPPTPDERRAQGATDAGGVEPELDEQAATRRAAAGMRARAERRIRYSVQAGLGATTRPGAGGSGVTRGEWKPRRRRALETTVTEDRAIAAAAKIGSSRMPVKG
jgi:hypothetical protein